MKNSFINPFLFSIKKSQDRGTNAEDLLNQNRRLVLQLIRNAGVTSRKSLSTSTGLKPATISLVINRLLEMGLIEEYGFIEGDAGRKIMGFTISHMKYCTISIRISPSYLKIASYDLRNENLYIKKIFINTLDNLGHTCDVITEEVELVKPYIGDREIIGVGVGVEGPFKLHNGYYKYPDSQNTGKYFDIGKELNRRLGIPILVNRQSNFCVYALWKEESRNNPTGIYVHIAVSYSVESGTIVNGEIVNGVNGTAGLIGNIAVEQCDGKPVYIKDLVSTDVVLEKVHHLIYEYPNSLLKDKLDDLNIRDVVKAYFLEDELALKIFNEIGEYLGLLIANIVHILNPDHIFIGDEVPTTTSFKEIIEKAASKHLLPGISPNIHTFILDYEESRDAKNDPALTGASSFVTDAFINTLDFS